MNKNYSESVKNGAKLFTFLREIFSKEPFFEFFLVPYCDYSELSVIDFLHKFEIVISILGNTYDNEEMKNFQIKLKKIVGCN